MEGFHFRVDCNDTAKLRTTEAGDLHDAGLPPPLWYEKVNDEIGSRLRSGMLRAAFYHTQ